MATTIKVTPQDLEHASSQIESLANDYNNEYEALFNRVNGMRGKWDGQDNQSFTDQVAGFRDDFEKMKALMDQYADYLRNTAKGYKDTQDLIVQGVKSLTN